MSRRDLLQRLERLEAIARLENPVPTMPALKLNFEGLTHEEIAHAAHWVFRGDHSQPPPEDVARTLTIATGRQWKAGEVIA